MNPPMEQSAAEPAQCAEDSAAPARQRRRNDPRWPQELEAALRKLNAQGATDIVIGERLGKSPAAITWKRGQLGLKKPRRAPSAQCPEDSAAPEAKKRYDPRWPPEKEAALRRMCEQGLSIALIAERLGKKEKAIYSKMANMGLKRKPKRKPAGIEAEHTPETAGRRAAAAEPIAEKQEPQPAKPATLNGVPIQKCPPGYAWGAEPPGVGIRLLEDKGGI